MAGSSTIEWTDFSWNPIRGCTVVSPGCTHCYAMKQAHRFSRAGAAYDGLTRLSNGGPVWTGGVRIVPKDLEKPLHLRKPRLVFVNSMSDLFHQDVPTEFIKDVFAVMERAHRHRFQVLTKRSERLRELAPMLSWPENVWMGVSVESERYISRIVDLQQAAARVRFLSLEPLLGPLARLPLDGIGWVIVGGESGPGARAIDPAWVTEIRDQCVARDVPFFFKQWGGVQKKRKGRTLEGRTWDQFPLAAAAR